jgi:hypothetical protein
MAEIRLSAGQAGQQWRDVAKKLRKAGQVDLRKNLRQRISSAGAPVVEEVKQAVRDLQVTSTKVGGKKLRHAAAGTHGGGAGQRRKERVSQAKATAKVGLEKARERAARRGAGLRETIAAGVRLQITAKGVRIIASSDRLPEKQKTLVRRLDSDKGWRHPVFGDREVWVHQRGGPWFAETIKKRAPDFRAAIVEAMEETKKQLDN